MIPSEKKTNNIVPSDQSMDVKAHNGNKAQTIDSVDY